MVEVLRLSNIKTPTNSPATPFIIPQLTPQPGAQLQLFPDVTKSRKGGHCTVTLSCSITPWLQLAAAAYEEANQSITNHITRPLHKGHQDMCSETDDIQRHLGQVHTAPQPDLHWQKWAQYQTGQDDRGRTQHQASIEAVQEAAMIRCKPIALENIGTSCPTRGS